MSAYLKFFALEKSPFDTRAQSALVLGTKALRSAFAEIEQALNDGAPRICVDGKAGLGKTSLARALPKLLGETARIVLILNPSLPWSTLRSAIVKQLDLAEGNLSRKTLMRARAEGRRLVIAIDQAERISSESLDHLDILLGYKNDDDEQLVHCVLLANLQAAASQHNEQGEQTPLLWWLDKLNTLQLEFQPIPAEGIASYVLKHLKRAGWKRGQIFTPEALQTIHRLTGGVPREVSDLCERALELAAEEQTDCIDAQLVEDVFGEIPLDELVGGEENDDVTDSAFVGPKDDQASSTTATFGGESATPSEPPPFVTPTAAKDEAGRAEDAASDATTSTDPRVDRMPSPGRSAHAPVDAPINLDSFFGESSPGPPALAEDVAEPAAPFDEAPTPSRSRAGAVKWIGIAAGVLLAVGGGGFAALSLLDGDAPEAAPAVIARPKAPATAAPVAGVEAHDPPPVEQGHAAAPPRTGVTTGLVIEGEAGSDRGDETGAALVRDGASAGTDLVRDGAPAEKAPALDETDPLLGFEGFGADSPEPLDTASTATRPAMDVSDRPDAARAGSARALQAAAPAAPAPSDEHPADAEVDAPFW